MVAAAIGSQQAAEVAPESVASTTTAIAFLLGIVVAAVSAAAVGTRQGAGTAPESDATTAVFLLGVVTAIVSADVLAAAVPIFAVVAIVHYP